MLTIVITTRSGLSCSVQKTLQLPPADRPEDVSTGLNGDNSEEATAWMIVFKQSKDRMPQMNPVTPPGLNQWNQ